MSEQLLLPNIELLSKQEGVVEMTDGPVHRVTVSHLHHRCSRFTFHEFHLKIGMGGVVKKIKLK